MTAVIGWLEGKAKSDDSFILNKIPNPIAALGWTGNLAAMAWVGSHFFRNKWLRLFARQAATVTVYQLARQGKAFASGKDFFTISGWTDEDVAAALEQHMGALSATGGAGGADGMAGVGEYDQVFGEYGGG
jgi:hypothetical protein